MKFRISGRLAQVLFSLIARKAKNAGEVEVSLRLDLCQIEPSWSCRGQWLFHIVSLFLFQHTDFGCFQQSMALNLEGKKGQLMVFGFVQSFCTININK